MTFDQAAVRYDERGLVPCIIQSSTGEVRMLAYMNAEALARTLETSKVTFFSRSRGALWEKGATSGHTLTLESIRLDCDGDTILVGAACKGPTCHRNLASCFSIEGEPEDALVPRRGVAFLEDMETLLRARKETRKAEGTYTEKLFFQGTDRIAKKVAEEAGEVLLAAKNVEAHGSEENRSALLGEVADLLFHLDMLLVHHDESLAGAIAVLRARHASRAERDERG